MRSQGKHIKASKWELFWRWKRGQTRYEVLWKSYKWRESVCWCALGESSLLRFRERRTQRQVNGKLGGKSSLTHSLAAFYSVRVRRALHFPARNCTQAFIDCTFEFEFCVQFVNRIVLVRILSRSSPPTKIISRLQEKYFCYVGKRNFVIFRKEKGKSWIKVFEAFNSPLWQSLRRSCLIY